MIFPEILVKFALFTGVQDVRKAKGEYMYNNIIYV